MITCYKCNKTFKYAYLLQRHLSGKMDCRYVSKNNARIRECPSLSVNIRNQSVKQTIDKLVVSVPKSNDIVNCDYCYKQMKLKNTYSHIRNACMKVPDDVRKRHIEKYNNRKDAKAKQSALDNVNNNDNINIDTINNINAKNIDNSSNSHNITNNNNITINLNTFNHESIEHLTKEDHLKILNTGVNMYDNYLKEIYKLDDNLNVYIEDKRKGIVGYIDKDKTLSFMREAKAVDMLTDKNMSELNNLYDEYEDELEYSTKKKANFNLDRYFNDSKDGSVKKEYRDLTYFMILKKSKLAKNRINDFIKLKDKDGNLMRLKDENGDEWVLINPHNTKLEPDTFDNSNFIQSNKEEPITKGKVTKPSIKK